MDNCNAESNEFSVEPGAFWHTKLDLYYGFETGEVVEVEHESDKYWLATVEYTFKNLILLKWIGNFGDFWVDTSQPNLSTNLCNEYNPPKRLYPLGHHLGPQLKSQFKLDKPTRFLTKPTLYNPTNDPYANINNVDELLAYEVKEPKNDLQTIAQNNEPVVADKVEYCEEDFHELITALEYFGDGPEEVGGSAQRPNKATPPNKSKAEQQSPEDCKETNTNSEFETQSKIGNEPENTKEDIEKPSTDCQELEDPVDKELDEFYTCCERLQRDAINSESYQGVRDKELHFAKPKQFFDLGGANHERVLVPGTLLQVAHTSFSHRDHRHHFWCAIILKNLGGRLTLRWFMCDEPKFKQGRLEMKSMRSKYLKDSSDVQEIESKTVKDTTGSTAALNNLPTDGLTFTLHYCDHRIDTFRKDDFKYYLLPEQIWSILEASMGAEKAEFVQRTQVDHFLNPRRINLDKDRPIIDNILDKKRSQLPTYLLEIKASNESNDKHFLDVLFSTPKTPKLQRGHIKNLIEPGKYSVISETIPTLEGNVLFVYPYDGNHAILPLSWGKKNQDCLSIEPSRNTSPSHSQKECSINPSASQDTTNETDKSGLSDPLTQQEATQLSTTKNSNTESEEQNNSDLSEYNDDGLRAVELDDAHMKIVMEKFKVMSLVEVVHPSSDSIICLGRIRKVVYPLLWIQISADAYVTLPFNSTDIYPRGWCELNNHPLVILLPPRKRFVQDNSEKKRKRARLNDQIDSFEQKESNPEEVHEFEKFDLATLNEKQASIDYVLNEKFMYISIYFNHKCFTGPSLSKSKICSLPQYVGPGPLALVMEEVMTKLISVAYVPPRILNDLSSKSFQQLLIARNLTNTAPMEFKAKYQKRVHREDIPVSLNPDEIALYCECVCEHLKCCYNLFGPNLYDGDDCPGHCRALTKSNKFMKRATYYREKARLGEFLSDNSNKKSSSNNNNQTLKTSRAGYAGRGSSDSTSSSLSRSDRVNSRASSNSDEVQGNDLKENLMAVKEMEEEYNLQENSSIQNSEKKPSVNDELGQNSNEICTIKEPENGSAVGECFSTEVQGTVRQVNETRDVFRGSIKPPQTDHEFNYLKTIYIDPENWSTDDIVKCLDACSLEKFKLLLRNESIDGQALLLLDKAAIKEYFHNQAKSDFNADEIGRFCRFVEYVKSSVDASS